MTSSAILAFVHHVAAFVLFAVLTVELVLMKGELTLASARSLLRMDAAYGISATLLLSIYPTLQFMGWRKEVRQGRMPPVDDATRRKIRTVLHVELTLLLVVILCAALMARGIGFLG